MELWVFLQETTFARLNFNHMLQLFSYEYVAPIHIYNWMIHNKIYMIVWLILTFTNLSQSQNNTTTDLSGNYVTTT